MNELVSIAIISKDRPKVLIQCLEELLLKTPNNVSLIIVDSSSSKEDKETIYEYTNSKKELAGRIALVQVNLKMGSLPEQRNICLKYCKTPYILYIDDDCFFTKDTFSKLENLIINNQNTHVFGCRIIQGDTIKKEKYSDKILPSYSIFFWTKGCFNIDIKECKYSDHIQGTFMCFNFESLKKVNGFNQNLIKGYAPFEDSYTVMNVAKETETRPLIDFSIKVVHGVLPRLQGKSRDLGLDVSNSYAYARNGIITSKKFSGNLNTIFALPVVLFINTIRIFRPISHANQILIRLKSFFAFIIGLISGIFFN